MNNDKLLRIEKLVLHFNTTQGPVQAVDGVDFSLDTNRAVVILGESGCGKSSLAKAILRLLPRNAGAYSGHIYLEGKDIMALPEEEFRQNVRWAAISIVPQAAMNALNPVIRVGEQVAEPAIVHLGVDKAGALSLVQKMFQHVGVPEDFINRYPFELSGGMRQRVAIAMALVTSPNLIILDEPTSALDVLTQANIFNVLKRLKKELGISFILITHDIATSSELADDVAIMYAGQIVEVSDAHRFFEEPLHPYSKKLMASVPRLRGDTEPEFITGRPPSLINPPTGCRFADRCPSRFDKCVEEPPVFEIEGRKVKCWLYES
ncbi:MAG: dipeptide/oligopeptide/nickel ABC transporter ATP-binding protein [Anaerolineaceae bacterium]|jgi:oligopeptide/dipeptide ABC transporter ATP-binding protein|nr:ABC transporter ATP-binding protein [Anaerolineae bacterium]MBL1171981.1 ABC transporter ATP-binding protein [Chloroflexota bacterium]MBV6467544.1 Oligopeptide transport ATP-binding protein OppD [Anaerolineales bacterium]MCE7906395.1 ABC transporter ATP-binding protein [Anaerolineae bacterium CFX3]MDL1925567.1 ABC transporter ATP-binding protein [Anaerolineae bacterium AMX1]GER78585.1 dipeptide/oligopeptide/nickel ABC transporter ATP-binding protein [Candidatus Denitrolinea symbiosum]GJQ39